MTELAVHIDPADPTGPPRPNGSLTFAAPWQGRAFAICLAVLHREGLGWDAFRPHLIAQIDRDPDGDYYTALATALDTFLAARRLI